MFIVHQESVFVFVSISVWQIPQSVHVQPELRYVRYTYTQPTIHKWRIFTELLLFLYNKDHEMNGILFCSLAAITWATRKTIDANMRFWFLWHMNGQNQSFRLFQYLHSISCYYVTHFSIYKNTDQTVWETSICVFQQKFNAKRLHAIFSLCHFFSLSLPFHFTECVAVSIRSGASIELVSVLLHLKAVSANKINHNFAWFVCIFFSRNGIDFCEITKWMKSWLRAT